MIASVVVVILTAIYTVPFLQKQTPNQAGSVLSFFGFWVPGKSQTVRRENMYYVPGNHVSRIKI